MYSSYYDMNKAGCLVVCLQKKKINVDVIVIPETFKNGVDFCAVNCVIAYI